MTPTLGRAGEPRALDLAYYEAVPYLLVVEIRRARRASGGVAPTYPELPGCAAEADSAVEAIERLEQEREALLARRVERGEPIPVPRPPLRSDAPVGLTASRCAPAASARG